MRIVKSGVYLILNLVNNKKYVGAALNIKNRFRQHRHDLKNKKHGNRYLQNSWDKYGETVFEFKVLQYVEDIKELIIVENNWIKWLDCIAPKGYNVRLDANNNIGIKHTDQTKLNMSIAHRGKKQSEETKFKRSLQMKGRKFSQESLDKMSMAQIQVANLLKRKYDKWPCVEGIKCKCSECVKRKSAYSLEWYHKNKNKVKVSA